MNRRILCIDDEQEVLDVLRACLKTKGYSVVPALGGEAGLALAEQGRWDLITLDLMMPRMSGLEVLKRLKASPTASTIPVIVVSAVGADNSRPPEFWARGLGVAEFVQKPFDPFDLLGKVEYVFRSHDYGSGSELLAVGKPQDPAYESADSTSDLRHASPEQVVRAFVESWNDQDFATEYECLSDEMQGGLVKTEYVDRRFAAYQGEAGHRHSHHVREVVLADESANLAKVQIAREDLVDGQSRKRQETYVLKKTHRGWKIVSVRVAREGLRSGS
ncbi:MAG: response regulator [Candidatus Sumerlaeia bacterium]|nr:response regulator [Candidatus Sumerlaeia bacterium]